MKKILKIAMAILICLATTTTAVAQVITVATVTVTAPVAGQNPNYTITPHNATYTATIDQWRRVEPTIGALSPTDVFVEGHGYVPIISLTPAAGYSFAPTASLTVTINGRTAQFVRVSGGSIVYSITEPFYATAPTNPFAGGDGSAGNPYQISTSAQLAQLATFVNGTDPSYSNKHYILMNDIAITSYGGWTPIGKNHDYAFRGVFDGNGKKITDLYINLDETGNLYIGLFGFIINGTIKNLGIEDCYINVSTTGNADVGALVGVIQAEEGSKSYITNCYATGSITVIFGSQAYAGGLAGGTWNTDISNSYSVCSIAALSESGSSACFVGGIAGGFGDGGDLFNCYSIGLLTANLTSGGVRMGGIVGRNYSDVANNAALNPQLLSMSGWMNINRVVGFNEGDVYSNLAFNTMLNAEGTTWWNETEPLNGTAISASAINADGTLGGRFTAAGGWTTENGKLPGLFGNTVNMPDWLLVPEECEHEAGEWITEYPPTCTDFGRDILPCVICGAELDNNSIWPLGHYWGPWQVTLPPTETEEGEETRYCDRPPCDAFETQTIPAIGSGETIEIASVTITLPVVGQTPNFSATAGHTSYTVEMDGWWSTSAGSFMEATDVFVLEQTYTPNVRLTPTAGNSFAVSSSLVVTINGVVANFHYPSGSSVIYGLQLTPTFTFETGNGTAGNPYQIKTAADLAAMAFLVNSGEIIYNSAHYKLMNNIDLSAYGEDFNGGNGWIPIGVGDNSGNSKPFAGVFDGNQKIITGLYINGEGWSSSFRGLFGYVEGGTVKNLGLEDVNVTGHWIIGGLVARMYGGVISHCYVTGTITGNYTDVGGIVGEANGVGSDICVISHCYSTAAITVNGTQTWQNAGGIAGRSSNGTTINNCWSSGNIMATTTYVGGISGTAYNTTVENCVALNVNITATNSFGRITGFHNHTGTLINNLGFDEMLLNGAPHTWTSALDGDDISIPEIHADGTLGGRFTSANGWTTQNGKLPSLFGTAVNMPVHLSHTPVAPTIVTATLPNGKEGEAYSVTLFATGTNPIAWSVSAGSLPAGLSLSGATISGTPATFGTFNFTIMASNAVGNDTKAFSITIEETAILPVITIESIPWATLGVAYSFTLQATGTAPITWQLMGGSSIAGITLSSSGVLSGTPTTVGTFNFTVRATNAAGNVTKGLSITISATPCEHENTTDATCTTNGVCLDCGHIVEEAFGHTWGEWYVTFPPTETEDGEEERICETCSETETQSIPATGTSIVDFLETNIYVYPNPTTGELRIRNYELGIANIEIFDMMGKRVYRRHSALDAEPPRNGGIAGQASNDGLTIDISHLPNGIYILKIGQMKSIRIVKH
ncbi:MAG: putative Ig domain-containing protein [Bacteroidales bacterium]|nr:putative Ig domain-containing protein [Bacteroidales bacterium]